MAELHSLRTLHIYHLTRHGALFLESPSSSTLSSLTSRGDVLAQGLKVHRRRGLDLDCTELHLVIATVDFIRKRQKCRAEAWATLNLDAFRSGPDARRFRGKGLQPSGWPDISALPLRRLGSRHADHCGISRATASYSSASVHLGVPSPAIMHCALMTGVALH